MTTTSTPATKSLNRRRLEIAGCERQLAGYHAMLEVARKFDMDFEIDQLTRNIAEFEGELEHLIEEAADAGFGPEDFE